MDFDIKRRSRVCSITDRELGPGENYYSVLVEEDDEVVRKEISSAAWDGPPEGCISWWQSRIPERDPNRFFWAPDNVIIDYFESFLDDENKQVERYVLALVLMQKRIFRLTDTEVNDDGSETMFLACARRGSDYEINVANPKAEDIAATQDELVNLLFSDEPFEEVDESFDMDSGDENSSNESQNSDSDSPTHQQN